MAQYTPIGRKNMIRELKAEIDRLWPFLEKEKRQLLTNSFVEMVGRYDAAADAESTKIEGLARVFGPHGALISLNRGWGTVSDAEYALNHLIAGSTIVWTI